MNYEQAKKIARRYAPRLVIDPPVKGHSYIMHVRKVEGGTVYAIHMPPNPVSDGVSDPESPPVSAGVSREFERMLDAAMVSLGV